MLARTALRALRSTAGCRLPFRTLGAALAPCTTSASHGRSSELPAAATPAVLTRDGADELSAKLVGDLTLGVRPQESEVRDPKLIFDLAWATLHRTVDPAKVIFPREIVWLSGAPGAGKGTMASFIMSCRDISHIFEVSGLLNTPEMKRRKEAGELIGDKEVVQAVLEELVKEKHRNGVVVDGFPRTLVQAETIKLLFDKLQERFNSAQTNPSLRAIARRPIFNIACLYCDENVSVKRQIARGKELLKFNEMVADTGFGSSLPVRATDVSEESARKRFHIFKNENFAALQVLKEKFPFHFIPADGTPDEVATRIRREFAYQAEHDLADDTFDMMRSVETAQSIIRSARSNLVSRLNSYASEHRVLFEQALDMVAHEFMHIVKRQALMGCAIIRSNNPMLENPLCLNMVLDILAERGFTVILDVIKAQVPSHMDPIVPGDAAGPRIHLRVEKHFIFRIEFKKPEIRRNE